MPEATTKPQSTRAKLVLFIWKNLPRLVLICMIFLSFLLFTAISEEKERLDQEKREAVARGNSVLNVVTLTVSPSVIRNKINLPGEIEPWNRLQLQARVGGSIVKVQVEEGDTVQQGQIVAEIEDTDYKIALQRAKAVYALAKANYQRDKKIHAGGAVPTAELEAKKPRLETARADVENAELLLSRCSITAPISGVINRLDAKKGMFVSVGDPVAEILQLNPVKAVVGIPESDISEVRKLEQIDISITSLNNLVVTGKKKFLASAPDSMARSYRLELEIDNPAGEILPGMFVRANVVKQVFTDALQIPFYSVISRGAEQYLFVEKEGMAEKRAVSLGILEGWQVQVTEGLAAGEHVIIEGQRDVEDGQKVQVIRKVTDLGDYTL